MSIYVTGNLARSLAERHPIELSAVARVARPDALRLGPAGGTCTVVRLTPVGEDGCVVLGARDLARLLLACAGERTAELLADERDEVPAPAHGF